MMEMIYIILISSLLLKSATAQLLNEPCQRDDCNNHGTCLGLSVAPICFCDLGFTGLRCEIPQNSGLFGGIFDIFQPAPGLMPLVPCTDCVDPIAPVPGITDWFTSLPTSFFPWMDNLPDSAFFAPFKKFARFRKQIFKDSVVTSSTTFEPTTIDYLTTETININNSEPSAEESNMTKRAVVSDISHQMPNLFDIFTADNYSLPITQGLNACGPEDCNNNGVCVGTKTLPVCLCHLGFTGQKCENTLYSNTTSYGSGSTIICLASDCNNNGICVGTKSSFSCLCKLGYSGQHCESTPYPLCDVSDCNNHGLCIGTKQSYTCACYLGYSGERCDTAKGTLCDISDCNTQGICIGTKDQFTCLCNLGYTGTRCETRVLDQVAPLAGGLFCELKDCNNNGLCIGTKLLPTCICNLGYLGLRCELEPLCSSLLQCSGNGLCLGTLKNSLCACNLGWSGPNCQYFGGLGK